MKKQVFMVAAWFCLSINCIRSMLDVTPQPDSLSWVSLVAFMVLRVVPMLIAIFSVAMFLLAAIKLYHDLRRDEKILNAFKNSKVPREL